MKHIALALSLLLTTAVSGCTPTWFKDFKTNPVGQINSILTTADAVIQIATAGFNELKTFLPEEKQLEFQTRWDSGIVAFAKAKAAVNSAARLAADAEQPSLDLAALFKDVTDSALNIQALVKEVAALTSATPSTARGFSTAKATSQTALAEMDTQFASYQKLISK